MSNNSIIFVNSCILTVPRLFGKQLVCLDKDDRIVLMQNMNLVPNSYSSDSEK